MQETVFKLEEDDELIDVMSIRIVERTEIEIFVLTQVVGVLELLENKILFTGQGKKSVLSKSMLGAMEDIGSDEDLLMLLNEGVLLQRSMVEVDDAVAKKAKELKERFMELLRVRLNPDQEERRTWDRFYRMSLKEIKELHRKTWEKLTVIDEETDFDPNPMQVFY